MLLAIAMLVVGYLRRVFLDNWYPSGHTTITTFLGLALVLLAPVHWRWWVSVVAGIVSSSYAAAVLFAGWHRPSDAIGGIAWSGICIASAALVSVRLRGRAGESSPYVSRAVLASGGLAVLMTGFVWLAAANTADEYPDADVPFLVLTAVIIASSFVITAWFGWVLRAVDWVEPA